MPLSTSVLPLQPSDHASPFVALAVPEGPLPPSLAHLDAMTKGAIGRVYQAGDFVGKKDETVLVHAEGPASRYLLIGLGKPEDASRSRIRRAAAVAAKRARAIGVPGMAFYLSPKARGTVSARDAGQVIAEGLAYGAWHYPDLKEPPEDRKPPLETAVILAPADAGEFITGHATGAGIAAGQTLTRGLQVLPGNMCPPRHLAEVATELGKRHGFKVTVLDLAAIRKEGMGGLLAVAQGSAEEPRFIVLEYEGAAGAPVVLVGKGVTFDTGGISIKPADKMEDMKYDMSGAAAVLG
ncbi:MAG: leucyl aminopeptidase, partial [Gemmatimonadota bacterium]|nr:leucyl aminopeptidase [Gemmatimonadota bacterium]